MRYQETREEIASDFATDALIESLKADNFEHQATHGYTDEAIEVFTHIDANAYEVRDRLLMGVMMATPDTLRQKQTELYRWFHDQVKAVMTEKFN